MAFVLYESTVLFNQRLCTSFSKCFDTLLSLLNMDYSEANLQELAAFISRMTKMRTAHGVLMCLSVVVWFPMGVFLLRLLKVQNTVRWHAIWQSIGLIILIVGFGIGSWVSKKAGVSNVSLRICLLTHRADRDTTAFTRRPRNIWDYCRCALLHDASFRLASPPTMVGH